MASYIIKRVATTIPVLIGISIFAFLLSVLAPGNPAEISLKNMDSEIEITDKMIHDKEVEMGLDKPLSVQYCNWVKNVFKGDFGTAFITKRDIKKDFSEKLPVTVNLALFSTLITLIAGVLLGIIMANNHGKLIDHILNFLATFSMSLPVFWIALFCMTIFSETLHWLDTSGYEGFSSLIMPAIVLSLGSIGSTSRLMRATFLKESNKQYVLVANAKGLKERTIVSVHILKNAIMPIITTTGMRFAGILGGSAIVEIIFSLPGIGSYTLYAIQNREYYIVQAYVLYMGLIYVGINLLVDILYFIINPKMKLKDERI